MSRPLGVALCFVLGSAVLGAANKDSRLENCGIVMQEILDVPDNIPQELLETAECVIVIPSMTIIMGPGISVPESGRHLVDVLETNAPYNESKKRASQ